APRPVRLHQWMTRSPNVEVKPLLRVWTRRPSRPPIGAFVPRPVDRALGCLDRFPRLALLIFPCWLLLFCSMWLCRRVMRLARTSPLSPNGRLCRPPSRPAHVPIYVSPSTPEHE